MTTSAEKRYMCAVAKYPCIVCGALGVHLHHVRDGQGMAQRSQHWLVVPLCPTCHTSPVGVHGDKSMLRVQKLDEIDLLARTIEKMWGSR
jgi:Recombination enhancement, RecA-dependent nuclease